MGTARWRKVDDTTWSTHGGNRISRSYSVLTVQNTSCAAICLPEAVDSRDTAAKRHAHTAGHPDEHRNPLPEDPRICWFTETRLGMEAASAKYARQRHIDAGAITQDVIAMLYTPRARITVVATPRSRRAAPSCRGGVSSLLRLAQAAAPRLPSTHALGDWVSRAMSVSSPMAARAEFRPSQYEAR